MNTNPRLKGVILDMGSFDQNDVNLKPLLNLPVDWRCLYSTKTEDLLTRIQGADVIITNKIVIDRAILGLLPSLKLILIAATGIDNVDISTCQKKDITVCNVRHYATPAVVQHTIGLMLNLLTRQHQYIQDVRSGKWSHSEVFCLLHHNIIEAEGKTLGIVGYGTLGKKVSAVGRALGMNVIIAQRTGGAVLPGRVGFEKFLQTCDVISLHCPLNRDTFHLFSYQEFSEMKKEAVLINTARGAIVDSHALATALKEGEIAGAGIDVLEHEPPSPDHPLLQTAIPNLIVTPHNAWGTRESRQRLVDALAVNFSAWKAGTPVNVVS